MKQLKSHPPPGTSSSLSLPLSHSLLSPFMNSFSPLSSRRGIRFNDWFVADPGDRRAKRIHRRLSVSLCLTLKDCLSGQINSLDVLVCVSSLMHLTH